MCFTGEYIGVEYLLHQTGVGDLNKINEVFATQLQEVPREALEDDFLDAFLEQIEAELPDVSVNAAVAEVHAALSEAQAQVDQTAVSSQVRTDLAMFNTFQIYIAVN